MVAGPGSWASTRGRMNQAREHHTATEVTYMAGGTPKTVVVIAGGRFDEASINTTLSSVEIYDLKSRTFTAGASMKRGRSRHTATWLQDIGKLLVVGGMDRNQNAMSSCELYDPGTNTWSDSGELKFGRMYHSATRCKIYGGDSVVVVGGYSTSNGLTVAQTSESYNPSTRKWSSQPLNTPRAFHGAALTKDKRNSDIILVSGGCSSPDGSAVRSFETLNLERLDGWKQSAKTMNAARQFFNCIGMRNGTPMGNVVLAAGGLDENNNYLNSAEWYNNATQSWRKIEALMPIACAASTTARIGDSSLWMISGGTAKPQQAISMLCDTNTSSFPTAASIGHILNNSTATSLSDGTVLVSGGYEGSGYTPTNAAYIFTPSR